MEADLHYVQSSNEPVVCSGVCACVECVPVGVCASVLVLLVVGCRIVSEYVVLSTSVSFLIMSVFDVWLHRDHWSFAHGVPCRRSICLDGVLLMIWLTMFVALGGRPQSVYSVFGSVPSCYVLNGGSG